ncbi:Vinorine synthase-like [Melia azedarach]|uniref:Vinorine synthase-like n=1 Tax=Melia azedarach TaxID=155640 RepID=A0ACC1YCV4_MELAZ|nr:Vinorine synthase-like [Melia azedarach]
MNFLLIVDDYGAAFVEARVAVEMSESLKTQDNDFLEKLVPFKMNEKPSFPVSLIFQVTYFGCGGIAICVGFHHIIADMTTAANFIKHWAAIACGSNVSNDIARPLSDFTSIFHSQNLSGFSRSSFYEGYFLSTEIMIKRFTFDGAKIASLRQKIGNESSSDYYPTRFEAVSALILGGVMTAAREEEEFNYTHLVASTAVNLRKRMSPPLPEQSIGNVIQSTTANWPMKKNINYNKLAEKLHEATSMITDDYVRKVHANGGFLNHLKNAMEGSSMNNNSVKNFPINSWLRFSFYGVDFGWGKPIWVSSVMKCKDVAILLDSHDDKGIEALVGLSQKEMVKFEQDPGILAYSSPNPSNSYPEQEKS